MGKIKAVKGLGKAFLEALEAVTSKSTKTRNKESAEIFKQIKKGVKDRNISSKKMFKIMKGVKGKD